MGNCARRGKITVSLCGAVLTASLGVWDADAATIFVDNPSFETLPPGGFNNTCVGGCSSYGVIPGWTDSPTNSGGQWQPTTQYFNYVPEGATIAYNTGGSISQTVSTLARPGFVYTLSVDVGFAKTVYDYGTAYLVVDGVYTAATGAGVQLSGNWYEYTASYKANAAGPIEIYLAGPSSPNQGDWDAVQLSSSAGAAPEPSTWALMLLGFAGLGFAGYRRTKSRNVAAAA